MIKLFEFSVKMRITNLLLPELFCRLILHLFLNIETFNLFFYSLLCKNVRIEWSLKQILGCSYINEHKMENYHWYKKKPLPTRRKIQDPTHFLHLLFDCPMANFGSLLGESCTHLMLIAALLSILNLNATTYLPIPI